MNLDVSPVPRLPRRCGNCRHAARSGSVDGSIITCVVRLEYHCADRVPDCGHYHPSCEIPEDGCEND